MLNRQRWRPVVSQALAVAAGPSQLVGGQADDLRMQFADCDVQTLEKIHRRKTGALLAVSLELGAITANAEPLQRDRMSEFGKHLGLAFQIVDDLLDLRGSQAKMGKRTGKDAEHGKQTYPAVIGEEASENLARERVEWALRTIEPFGDKAQPLEFLAKFVLNRAQ